MRRSFIRRRTFSVATRPPRARYWLPFLSLMILALVLVHPPVDASQQSDFAIAHLNSARGDADAPPLAPNEDLNHLAAAYADRIIADPGADIGAPDATSLIQDIRGVAGSRTSDSVRAGFAVGYGQTREAAVQRLLGTPGHQPAVLDPVLADLGLAWRQAPAGTPWMISDPASLTGVANLQGQFIVVAVTLGSGR